MNALDDPRIIEELYRASQGSVQIDLIVRGHSRLRPGLPGYSDNIRIISIIGRFLEHDRIFYFGNAGDREIFVGSAGRRKRNLDERVEEVLIPVRDPALRDRLTEILDLSLADNRLAYDLGRDGSYVQRSPDRDDEVRALHDRLLVRARQRAAQPPWEMSVSPVGVDRREHTNAAADTEG